MIYRFRFWKEWCDEQGRMWAEPYSTDTSSDARREHAAAMGWHWCQGKEHPSVSDLMSIAYVEDPTTGKKREQNRTRIADGGAREYHEATLSGLRSADRGNPVPDAQRPSRAEAPKDGFDTPF